MFEKELQKLKREDLLQIILAQSREIDSLKQQLEGSPAEGIPAAGEESAIPEPARIESDALYEAAHIESDALYEAARIDVTALPETSIIEETVRRVDYQRRLRAAIVSTLMMLASVAAAAVLIATLFLPILRIYGQSMSGTLDNGDIVISVKTTDLETGDIVAFYYNNTILVKRVIGKSGDWIDIAKDGTVSVNQVELEEPYLDRKAYGQIDIELPYQVPENRTFVMGDNREVSIDSRTMMIGCVSEEQIVGKIVCRVWPFSRFGAVK